MGIVCAFALFAVMQALIANDQVAPITPTTHQPIDFVYTQSDEKVIEKPDPRPKLKPPVQPPQRQLSTATETEVAIAEPLIAVNTNFVGELDTGVNNAGGFTNGDAAPIVRVEPRYPAAAARNGIEGWVSLQFSINELGAVEDVLVIEAQPKRVFDREAKRALSRWKYKPQVIDGVPQKQTGLTVKLEFNMN
ncbi:energy transducer TonB [Saccharobesus litoralis]|uniref:Protein TonB n=2 Tax=Saccharobesus litoralis TaxID=2172099 RepID=A0A2S0VXV3_9ALTE|nr:energy transducer TonB [Saccharobesus litoralis]